GDALKDLGGDPRLDQDAELRLPEHVDEAGSDYFAVRIDRFRARGLFEVADRRNSSVSDAEIARIPRGARSIDDPSVHDHEIEALVSGLRDRRDRGPKQCQPGRGPSRSERPGGPSSTVAGAVAPTPHIPPAGMAAMASSPLSEFPRLGVGTRDRSASSGGEAERYALCCAGRNLPRHFSSIAVQQTRA